MVEYKKVQGTQDIVPEIEVNVDTVYVRTNIQRKSEKLEGREELFEYWEYDEKQYTLREWTQILSDKNHELLESQKKQDRSISATQEAVEFLMFDGTTTVSELSVDPIDDRSLQLEDKKNMEVNKMAIFLAERIEAAGEKGIAEGKKTYIKFLSDRRFKHLKSDVDIILSLDGKEDLIAELV